MVRLDPGTQVQSFLRKTVELKIHVPKELERKDIKVFEKLSDSKGKLFYWRAF